MRTNKNLNAASMKKDLQNKNDIILVLTRMDYRISAVERKVDELLAMCRQAHNLPPSTTASPEQAKGHRPDVQARGRVMHKAVCADCQKECEVPFRPSGERPVYCQPCFSRRRSGSSAKAVPAAAPAVPVVTVKSIRAKKQATVKKKAAAAGKKNKAVIKKPVAKKKTSRKKR